MNDIKASVAMLIRRPVSDVFNAFVDPQTIEQFWLRRASGALARDAIVEWEFMVAGAQETVTVTEFIANEVIGFTWSDGVIVRMTFDSINKSSTRFSVIATGFTGADASSLVVNATEGFAIVVCDLKCLLETGQSGNMVRDKAALIGADKPDI